MTFLMKPLRLGALSGLILAPFATAALSEPPATVRPVWDTPSCFPDRIIASPTRNAATGFSVNWRTAPEVSEAIAEIVESNDAPRMDLGASAVHAKYQSVNLEAAQIKFGRQGTPNYGRGTVNYFSAQFGKLKADTLYSYRVRGGPGCWSQWYDVRTGPADDKPVTFLFMGDAQYGLGQLWGRVVRQAVRSAADAAFVTYAGDLVNQGDRDEEWAKWFHAVADVHATIPVIPAAGNHDYNATGAEGTKGGDGVINPFWQPQFALPVEKDLPAALQETVYDFRYGSFLHMFAVDSSTPDWDVVMKWLEKKASASDAPWKIVVLHHSPYRPGIAGRKYHEDRQKAFTEVARKAGIHVVLAGHNHSYSRASIGKDVGPGLPYEQASVRLRVPRKIDLEVVIATSGAMSGQLNAKKFAKGNEGFGNNMALERWGNNTPTYQVAKADKDSFTLTSYTATGKEYDAFTLARDSKGDVILTNGEAAFGPVRHFGNSEPYREPDDLR